MDGRSTYQRYRHDNENEIDSHVSDCIRKEHPEGVHAFLLECRERAPIGFKVLAASRRDCNEEGHNPQDDDYDGDPADHVELAAAKYSAIEKANGKFQEPEGYRVDQVKRGLQLVLVRINQYVQGPRRDTSREQLTLPSI